MSKLAFRAQTVDIAYLPLRQDFLTKTVLMTAQRDFRLGNSPFIGNVEHTNGVSVVCSSAARGMAEIRFVRSFV